MHISLLREVFLFPYKNFYKGAHMVFTELAHRQIEFLQRPRFPNVVLDLDSTLTKIEGIDWLARIKNVADQIAPLTSQAMNGELTFADVFERRLEIISPNRDDLRALGPCYAYNMTDGAEEFVRELTRQGRNVFVVSGGMNPAVRHLTHWLGIPDEHVYANELRFKKNWAYAGFDRTNPLWRNDGKIQVLRWLKSQYSGKFALVGDGMGDLEASREVDHFVCFAGVAKRPQVMERAWVTVTAPSLVAVLEHL